MSVNKVIYENLPLIDLTSDTAEQSNVLKNYSFHNKAGDRQSGTAGASIDGTTLVIPASQGSVSGTTLSLS